MAPRQISTTSNLSRFANRRSLANLSMAQKQIAPTTIIIRTPIKTEIMHQPSRRSSRRQLRRASFAGQGIESGKLLEREGAGEHAARRRRVPHGPYLGAGVWLKSLSSATQVKFAAMLVLPLPLYFATLGKTQSGRVI